MLRSCVIAAISLAMLAGCASNEFRVAVGSFSNATSAAVDAQSADVEAHMQRRADDIANALAKERVRLTMEDCVAVDITTFDASKCRVVRTDGKALERPFKPKNVLALGKALKFYAENLGALAAASDEDGDAFKAQFDKLAVSVGKLGAKIKEAGGPTPPTDAQTAAVAKIVAEVGLLWFEYQRHEALKRIVIANDSIVQDATALLAAAGGVLTDSSNSDRLFALADLEDKLAQTLANPGASEAEVRAAQTAFMEAVDAYRADYVAPIGPSTAFAKLGAAHADLKKAAQGSGSTEDIKAAIERILEAVAALKQPIKDLQ